METRGKGGDGASGKKWGWKPKGKKERKKGVKITRASPIMPPGYLQAIFRLPPG
jgi:hypothetical protein